MAGQIIVRVADKETLDEVKANTNAILAAVGDDSGVRGVKRYGIKINKNDSNPDTRCEYIFDAIGMKPAKMNYAQGTFDIGDWGDVFFVKNNYPAMVKYDGHEDYKLDPLNHALKMDGSPSDVANNDYMGNAMSVFDGSGTKGKIWLSQFEIGNYEYIVVSNTRYDETFNDYAYVREDGTHADKLYYPMFAGSYDGTRLRSIADKDVAHSTNATTEVSRAKANGKGWDISSWSRRNLLNCLLKIISKHENTQEIFGNGDVNTYVDDASKNYGHVPTGTLKDKGQFFGFNDSTHEVKVFFIESWWGNRYERQNGMVVDHGKVLVKMTPPYNFEGKGYEDTGIVFSDKGEGYIKTCLSNKYGRIPTGIGGSSATYNCDYMWWNDTIVSVPLAGGYYGDGARAGAECLDLGSSAGFGWYYSGASLFLEQPGVA